MSETLVQRATPLPPHSRREVINVDDMATDDEVQYVHTHHPSYSVSPPAAQQARDDRDPIPEVIIVNDSDEEVEEMPRPSNHLHRPQYRIRTALTHRGSPRVRRRTFFSPSPPPQDNHIPPVPPLPSRLLTGPTRFRRSGPEFPGVFRPLDHPFAFEDGIPTRGRMHHSPPRRTIPEDVERPSRPSNMGLGGALLAFNRHAVPRESSAQPASSSRRSWTIPGMGLLRRIFTGNVWGNASPEPAEHQDEINAVLQEALAFENEGPHYREPYYRLYPRRHAFHSGHMVHDELFNRRDTAQSYKPHYTHPAKPEAGFTNDFAVPETISIVDGPGSSTTTAQEPGAILACVNCLDPLVMNIAGSVEEARRRRLWALRCGHMLDGKCVEILMKPLDSLDAAAEDDLHKRQEELPSNQSKGKRKASYLDDEEPAVQPASTRRDRKGKGRAYPSLPLVTPSTSAVVLDNAEHGQKPPIASLSHPESPHRLRHQHASEVMPVSPPSSDIASVGEFVPWSQASIVSPGRTLRGGSSRGRGRGERLRGRITKARARGARSKAATRRPPMKSAEYEWSCPVANCGYKHKSVLIQNEWRLDEERGPIAVYI